MNLQYNISLLYFTLRSQDLLQILWEMYCLNSITFKTLHLPYNVASYTKQDFPVIIFMSDFIEGEVLLRVLTFFIFDK